VPPPPPHETHRYWQFRTLGATVMVDWFCQRKHQDLFAHSLLFLFNNVWKSNHVQTEDERKRCNIGDQMGNASNSCLSPIQHSKQTDAHRIKNSVAREVRISFLFTFRITIQVGFKNLPTGSSWYSSHSHNVKA
jgi:hypothetical protein